MHQQTCPVRVNHLLRGRGWWMSPCAPFHTYLWSSFERNSVRPEKKCILKPLDWWLIAYACLPFILPVFLLQEHCFSFIFQCPCCSLLLPSALQYFLSDVCFSFNFILSRHFCPSSFKNFITHLFSLLNFCRSLYCFRFMSCRLIIYKMESIHLKHFLVPAYV